MKKLLLFSIMFTTLLLFSSGFAIDWEDENYAQRSLYVFNYNHTNTVYYNPLGATSISLTETPSNFLVSFHVDWIDGMGDNFEDMKWYQVSADNSTQTQINYTVSATFYRDNATIGVNIGEINISTDLIYFYGYFDVDTSEDLSLNVADFYTFNSSNMESWGDDFNEDLTGWVGYGGYSFQRNTTETISGNGSLELLTDWVSCCKYIYFSNTELDDSDGSPQSQRSWVYDFWVYADSGDAFFVSAGRTSASDLWGVQINHGSDTVKIAKFESGFLKTEYNSTTYNPPNNQWYHVQLRTWQGTYGQRVEVLIDDDNDGIFENYVLTSISYWDSGEYVQISGTTGVLIDSLSIKPLKPEYTTSFLGDETIPPPPPPTNVSSCQSISVSGDYVLTQNLSSSSDCITINAHNVEVDCNGYDINFAGSFQSAFNSNGYDNITIKNCFLTQNASDSNTARPFTILNSDNLIITNVIVENHGFEAGTDFRYLNNFNVSYSDWSCPTGDTIWCLTCYNCNDTTFHDNTLFTDSSSGYGIKVYADTLGQSGVYLYNNNVTSYGQYTSPINVESVNDVVISNNVLFANDSWGVYIDRVNDSIVQSNDITSNTRCVYANWDGSNYYDNLTIRDNILLSTATGGGGSSAGFNVNKYNNVDVINNTIDCFGADNCRGIYYIEVTGGNVSYNDVTTIGTNSHAVYLIQFSGDGSVNNDVWIGYNDLNVSTGSNCLGFKEFASDSIYQKLVVTENVCYDMNKTDDFDEIIIIGFWNNTLLTNQDVGSYHFDAVLLSFENSDYGLINYTEPINVGGGNLSENLTFNNNSVFSDFDYSANVTLYGVGDRGFVVPAILKDGVECLDCVNFTSLTATNVKFSVTGFSEYEVGDLFESINLTVHSPINATYSGVIGLSVSANSTIDTAWFSLDGASNVTFVPNDTLVGVSVGSHELVVWANNSFNSVDSETVYFSVVSGVVDRSNISAFGSELSGFYTGFGGGLTSFVITIGIVGMILGFFVTAYLVVVRMYR